MSEEVTVNVDLGWYPVDVPVIDGVATLPDGRTVVSSAKFVRVPVFTGDRDLLVPIPEPDYSLDAAWGEAEAALPDGWDLSVGSHRIGAGYFAVATHPVDDLDVTSGEDERHATPAAALRALAKTLRSR